VLKRNKYFLLISLLTLLTFISLYIFRGVDDNGLTSWQWVFDRRRATTVFLVLVPGAIFAFWLSKVFSSLRRPAVFFFLFSFVAVVPFWGEPAVIIDSSRYFTQAKHLEIYGLEYFLKQWGKDIAAWTDMPLVPFLFGLIFKVAGEVRLYVQVFTTLLFAMTVVITYLIGKELWDEDTGLCGTALLLGFPYLLTQVPLMLVDVPTMFFLTLAVYTSIKASRGKDVVTVMLASLSIFLVFFSKYSTWPMLSVLAIVYLVGGNRDPGFSRRACLNRGLLVLLTSSLLIGAVVLLKRDVMMEQIRLLISYQKPGLNRWGESFASMYFYQVHPFVTILALLSLWAAFKKRDKKYAIISGLIILALVFHIRRIRYILPLFPMGALMASYGLQQIRDSALRRFAVLCIILSSLSVAYVGYLPFTRGMSAVNLSTAGHFLDTLGGGQVDVFTAAEKDSPVNPAVSVPLLDLFTKKKVHYSYLPSFVDRPRDFLTSPLRFTWEYRNPPFYAEAGANERRAAVVFIRGGPDIPPPDALLRETKEFPKSRSFNISTDHYIYKTFLTVYYK
jgi:hypothetical protein